MERGTDSESRHGARAQEPWPSDRETLRALVRLASLFSSSRAPDDLVEVVAEAAREMLAAASLSISSFDPERPLLRTVINVGVLGAREQRWPTDEVYEVVEFPSLVALREGRGLGRRAAHVDDPEASPAEVALLHSLGKVSSLRAALVVDGEIWGELWASRTREQPPFDERDGDLIEVLSALVSAGLSQAFYVREMSRLASTDPLTGIANRRAFEQELQEAMDRARLDARPVSVAVLDLNRLKQINDREGHAAGDALLRLVAARLSEAARTVPGGTAARLGGDEFGLLLPGLDSTDALQVARPVCAGLQREPFDGVACGVATSEPLRPFTSGADLLDAADQAQYRAKRWGAQAPVVADT